MFQLGIYTAEQFDAIGLGRRLLGPRISYSLLDVGDNASPEEIRRFEDICFTMRLSNGTFRTSFRNRFADVNTRVKMILEEAYRADEQLLFEDRAVSHALTAIEWARDLLVHFARANFEASDLLLNLIELRGASRRVYIAEPDGTVLQVSDPPLVLSLFHNEPRRFPVNQLMAKYYRRQFDRLRLPPDWTEPQSASGFSVRSIPLVHPEVRGFERHEPRFRVVRRSVFDVSSKPCHAVRTMNILNRSYFNDSQLLDAAGSIYASLVPGGVWILGRTLEDSLENHVSILRRSETRWEVVERLGDGSEIESLVLGTPK